MKNLTTIEKLKQDIDGKRVTLSVGFKGEGSGYAAMEKYILKFDTVTVFPFSEPSLEFVSGSGKLAIRWLKAIRFLEGGVYELDCGAFSDDVRTYVIKLR